MNSPRTHLSFNTVLLNLHEFMYVLRFPYYWFLVLHLHAQIGYKELFPFPLFVDPFLTHDLCWRQFMGCWRNVDSTTIQWNVLWVSVKSSCCHLITILFFHFPACHLSIGESGVLESHSTSVLGLICVFPSNSVCFIRSARGMYVTSSWWTVFLIYMKWLLLSFLISLGLKSILSAIGTVAPACI